MHFIILPSHLFKATAQTNKRTQTKNPFYLSVAKKKMMDNDVIKIEFPNEIKRIQRTITDNLGELKANEFRNSLLYHAPIIRKVQKSNYFMHYAAYVTSIRLMCQTRIRKEELHDAYILIDYFVKRYSQLYGRNKMNWKIHAHLHLPLQVLNFGNFIYITSFGFEGKMKIIFLNKLFCMEPH